MFGRCPAEIHDGRVAFKRGRKRGRLSGMSQWSGMWDERPVRDPYIRLDGYVDECAPSSPGSSGAQSAVEC